VRSVTLIIRPAQLADARNVAELHVATWRRAYRGIFPDEYLDSLSIDTREAEWRACLEQKTSELWVALDGPAGELAGWVSFGKCRDPDKPASTGEVWAIYVAPAHWSRGVGRALWSAAQRRLIELGFSEVTLWCLVGNERAERFYRSAGFVPTRSNKFPLCGSLFEEIRYEAPLQSSLASADAAAELSP
jgi:ribosomal protein S18 acetylase RimI-like enzyme